MTNKVFTTDIAEATLENTFFRKVISTTQHQQLVLMSIEPNDSIEFEIHPDNDQFIRVEKGNSVTLIGENKEDKYELSGGSIIIIPAGTWHQIINASATDSLKLYTIYSPPHHPKDKIDVTNPAKRQTGGTKRHSNLKNRIY